MGLEGPAGKGRSGRTTEDEGVAEEAKNDKSADKVTKDEVGATMFERGKGCAGGPKCTMPEGDGLPENINKGGLPEVTKTEGTKVCVWALGVSNDS